MTIRLGLATKISVLIIGVLALAIFSGVVALFSSWQMEGRMQEAVSRNLPSMRAAAELQIALLEQRGHVSSYMLDEGQASWVEELRRREPRFSHWLQEAGRTSQTPEEHALLAALEQVYRQYDAKRNEAISLFQEGEVDRAKWVLLYEVSERNGRAHSLCQQLIVANQQHLDSAIGRAHRQMAQVTGVVSVLVVLTVSLSALLLGLLFQGVLLPLRRMVAEVRTFSGEGVSGVKDQMGDELGAVGTYLRTLMSDVTDTRSTLQRSRDQLLQAEKLASVGKLAASVAHEIRNPLTAMKMWLFSIRKSVSSDAELVRRFDLVSDEMVRLESVVRNFLEFSRPPRLKPRPLDLTELVDATIELLAYRIQEKQVHLVWEPTPGLPAVTADAEQLKQVLINLIWNAAEAMSPGGEVRIGMALQPDGTGETMLVARIQDTGCGMPEEVRMRIFEPFYTTKEEGTGLGLCIAARIVARHGGRLVLESSCPQGSCFAIWLPLEFPENDEQDSDC